jgi:hypothetical protein
MCEWCPLVSPPNPHCHTTKLAFTMHTQIVRSLSRSNETLLPCMKKLVKDPLLYTPCHTHTNYITFYVKKPLTTTSTHKFKSFTLRPWFLLNLHIVMSTNKQGSLQWKKWGETLETTNLGANLSFILCYFVSLCIHLVFIDPYHVWPK